MKINKQAWHFYFASFANDYIKSGYYESEFARRKLDFCLYVRAVLKGGLLFALLFCVVTALSWCVVSTVLWVAVSLQYAWFEPPIPACICLGILFALSGALIIQGFFYTIRKGSQKVADAGPIREAYKSWKGKYCPLVTLHD